MIRILLYTTRYLLMALALGAAFANAAPIFTTFKARNRFLLGVSATPLFIALLAYLLGLIWPGAPRLLFILLPAALSLGYLFWKRNYRIALSACRDIAASAKAWLSGMLQGAGKWGMGVAACFAAYWFMRVFRTVLPETAFGCPLERLWYTAAIAAGCVCMLPLLHGMRKLSKEKLAAVGQAVWRYAVLCLALAMLTTALGAAYCYGRMDLYGSDEAHYATQARYFAADRDAREIDRYTGEKAGTVLPDDHGPLWPVYLADAEFCAPYHTFNSLTGELARLVTAPLMLLALANAAAVVGGGGIAGFFSIVLVVLYRYTLHFVLRGSRDGFRFIALIMLVLLIYEFSMRLVRNRDKRPHRLFFWRDAVALLLFSYLSLNGHGGNAYIMAGLFFAFGIIAIACRVRAGELLGLGAAALAGTALCVSKNISHFIRYGDFRSYSTKAFEGTPVVEQIQQFNAARSDPSAIAATYLWSDWHLIGVGSLVLLYCLIRLLAALPSKRRGGALTLSPNEQPMLMLGVLVAGMLLPLTGLFNVLGGDVSGWFIMQLRYRVYFLLLAALMGGVAIARLLRASRYRWAVIATRLAALALCVAALSVMDEQYYKPANYIYTNSVVAFYRESARMAESCATTGDVFTDDQIIAYYSETPPRLLFDIYARPLLIAETDEEIEAALRELQAQVFVFKGEASYDYSLLPFYAYIQNEAHAAHYILADEASHVDVFVVK